MSGQQETVEHIHDFCAATIAALRAQVQQAQEFLMAHGQTLSEFDTCLSEEGRAAYIQLVERGNEALAQPIPPAAAKLLARDAAGRALYEACTDPYQKRILPSAVVDAVEAYRRVVD